MGKKWALELRRAVGRDLGKIKDVAEKYGVTVSGVSAARVFVKREDAGEQYDENLKRWVTK